MNMTNAELNSALYKKLFAEQEAYKKWLLTQSPEEILNHSYEFTVREDILLSLEYHDLTDAQAQALLDCDSPLGDIFKDFEKRETGHMDTVFASMESRADAVLAQAEEVLEKHELIKIKILETAMMTPREAQGILCEALDAEPVQCIGTKTVIFRVAREPDNRHINPNP